MTQIRKYTLYGVAQVIQKEGLGYAVEYYMDGKYIADPKLADMWDECAKLMKDIRNYVQPTTFVEDGEEYE